MPRTTKALILALCLAAPALCPFWSVAAPVQDAQPAAKSVSFLGTVQSINGRVIAVENKAGASMQVTIPDNARLLRIEPGQTNLQQAAPLSLPDLQMGDRVLITGLPSTDGKQLTAVRLVAIKKTDIAQMQEREREEWQKNAVGGLVKSVDPAASTVVISLSGRRTLTIQVSKSTILRRYAPGSANFNDAKPAPLTDIKPGDQLHARGVKSADGNSFAAEEIVSGSFLNIAGTVEAVNPAASTLTVLDIATKHPVTVAVTPETQIKKLDPAVAQRIAMRLKGGAAAKAGSGNRPAYPGSAAETGQAAPDPQQILGRAPSVALKDLAKGDAVMMVAAQAASSSPVTAVTIVGGVEPMLQASASGSQAMLSSAWNLGGGGGGDESGGGGGGAEPQ